MRNIEYLWGILSSHENYHIPTMRNGKTTEILSSLLWDSHKIFWGIFVRAWGSWDRAKFKVTKCVPLPIDTCLSFSVWKKLQVLMPWISRHGCCLYLPSLFLLKHTFPLSQLQLTSSVFPSFHLEPVPGIIFHRHAVPSVVLLQCHTSSAVPYVHSRAIHPAAAPSVLHLPSFTVPQSHHSCSHRRHLSRLHTIHRLHRPSAHQEHSWMKFNLKWVENR